MTCLECVYHGPPVSQYRGARPCEFCISKPGFPKKQSVVEVISCQDVETGSAEPKTATLAIPAVQES